MTKKSSPYSFSEEERRQQIGEIIGFFRDERGEDIGVVAAEAVLDFMVDLVGKSIYEKGVTTAKKLIKERIEDMNIELDALLN